MKALILAAGYGTRLYPLVTDTPKPLLEIKGKALIDYILQRILTLKGLEEIYVITNEKFFGHFQDWVKKHSKSPVKISIISDGTKSNEDRLGSVGDINFFLKKKEVNDDLLIVGGDNLFDFNLQDFQTFVELKNPHVVIGVYDVHSLGEAPKFGVVELDKNGKIISFEEKPQDPKSTLIAMCLYYFPRLSVNLIFDYLKESNKADKAGDYIRWISQCQSVYGYVFKGKWYDIGSIESYQEAQNEFSSQ